MVKRFQAVDSARSFRETVHVLAYDGRHCADFGAILAAPGAPAHVGPLVVALPGDGGQPDPGASWSTKHLSGRRRCR